jgi:hypothetical protein
MIRASTILLVVAGLTAPVQGQDATWQFRWKSGESLDYRASHVTDVKETVAGNKVATRSKLDLVKRWHVTAVDEQGVATLELSIVSMRNEQVRPDGETLLFDSNDLDKSTPELRDMKKFLGTTLAVVRIDGHGRIREVKQGSAAKYQAEPPFVVVLPSAAPRPGQAWVRPFDITLEPPLGTGEKYPAQHRVTCAKIEAGKAALSLVTEIKSLPESAAERLPLVQKEVQGEVVFDIQAGRMSSARLNIDKTLENHQGPGSSYHFVSTYVEELIVAPSSAASNR